MSSIVELQSSGELPTRGDLAAALRRAEARIERAEESSSSSGFSVRAGDASSVESVLWLVSGLALVLVLTWLLGRARTTAPRVAPAAPRRSALARLDSASLAAQERYDEAIAARYDELITSLDARGQVRKRLGSTGRAYQRQLPAGLAERFGALLRELYPARFGGAVCDRARWQSCLQAADALERGE